MRTTSIVWLVIILIGVSLPLGVLAAEVPALDASFHIVPDAHDLDPSCDIGAPLSFGAVMSMVQSAIGIAIAFGILIFVMIMAWAGVLFITSATNPENRSTARKMLLNGAIGIMITLAAWLMVDFVMKTLYNPNNSGWGPWNSILGDGPVCVVATAVQPLFSGAITAGQLSTLSGVNDGTVPDGTVQNGTACPGPDCVSLAPEISCSASGCKVDKGLKQALVNTKSRNSGWTVTEAYPPSRRHYAACHRNGTCVDVGLRPQTYTVATITSFHNATKAAGLRAVFESKNQSLVNAVKANGVSALYIPGEHISADHFSVYSN